MDIHSFKQCEVWHSAYKENINCFKKAEIYINGFRRRENRHTIPMGQVSGLCWKKDIKYTQIIKWSTRAIISKPNQLYVYSFQLQLMMEIYNEKNNFKHTSFKGTLDNNPVVPRINYSRKLTGSILGNELKARHDVAILHFHLFTV